MEDQLAEYNCMVHGAKDFAIGQRHKLTWEDSTGEDQSILFEGETSLQGLINSIKWHLNSNKITSSPESDLLIDYK